MIKRILRRHRYRGAQSPWVNWLLRMLPAYPSLVESDQARLRRAA